jgi:succinate-acetate transporter protein
MTRSKRLVLPIVFSALTICFLLLGLAAHQTIPKVLFILCAAGSLLVLQALAAIDRKASHE